MPTFKDNDFLNEGQKLHVGEESKKNFLEKLKRDVEVELSWGSDCCHEQGAQTAGFCDPTVRPCLPLLPPPNSTVAALFLKYASSIAIAMEETGK